METDFLQSLRAFDKDHIPVPVVQRIKPYIANPEFEPNKILSVSTSVQPCAHALHSTSHTHKHHCVLTPTRCAHACKVMASPTSTCHCHSRCSLTRECSAQSIDLSLTGCSITFLHVATALLLYHSKQQPACSDCAEPCSPCGQVLSAGKPPCHMIKYEQISNLDYRV